MDQREEQDLRVQVAQPVAQVKQVLRGQQVPTGLLAHQVHPVQQDQQARREIMVPRVQRVIMAPPAQPVAPDL